jgi:uncharacterized protein
MEKTLRVYLEWLLRHRIAVIGITLLITAAAVLQVRNLRIVIDPNKVLPQSHPYVVTSNLVEKIFGSKYVAVIGITPKDGGDIFRPEILRKVHNITAGLLKTPGVVKENLLSLSARRAKNIAGTEDGMEVKPLMAAVPKTDKQLAALRAAVDLNTVYNDVIVSGDRKTAGILAEFKEDSAGFRAVMQKIEAVVAAERDPWVEIAVGGLPAFLAPIETFSERVNILFPLAVFIVGLIHLEAFRTFQGLILPLVTAVLAVAWGVGLMGLTGIPLDTFNAATPVLILAVAAGHAVQLLKRYYDEYDRIRTIERVPPKEANEQAVIQSVMKVGPVMIIAGGIAALGFFSLVVFEITSVRTFGVFTGIGILSALILEMTFTPALRSLLPPPGAKKRKGGRGYDFWDRITLTIARFVLTPLGRLNIYWGAAFVLAIAAFGMTRVVMDNSTKNFFADGLAFRNDDKVLNERLSGTNNLYVLVQGAEDESIKDPKVLEAMDQTARFVEKERQVGKVISIADFIKRMNQAMNGDDLKFYRVPESRELVSQFLLLYSMSGEPGDFDSYVDYTYRRANMTVFLKTDSSAYLQELIPKVKEFMTPRLPPGVSVSIGGSVPQGAALNEVMVHSKILNILQIAGVVFLVSALVFRSIVAGILILIPLVMAVIVNFGVMGWSGMLLNVPTSLCSAMAVGIGADYAIYLIYRLREELARGLGERAAIIEVLRSAGKASLFVASAVAGGYAVLFLSFGFHVHQWLAALICTAMLVSVFAALTLIPSLVLTFRPQFVFAGVSALASPSGADWKARLGKAASAKLTSFKKLKL